MMFKSLFDTTKKFKGPILISIWVVHISALAGISIGYEEWFLTKTPWNLLLLTLYLIVLFPVNTLPKLGFLILCILTGLGAEWIGVHTGLLFGNYEYLNNLGPKIKEVPFLIGINWAVLTFITAEIGRLTSPNKMVRATISALLMVLLDVFIEPSAKVMGFWGWENDIIPAFNFICWFVVALLLQSVAQLINLKGDSELSLHTYAAQLFFFGYLYVIFQI